MAKILVVDDEIGIRELLSEILADEGYDVKLAENASQARAFRQVERPDLVLLDIWMPDTDGITLLKEWSSGGQLTMPVVMMSGHGTIDSAVEATRIGAQDFLEKPIALQKLLATVKRALQRSPAPVRAQLSLAAFQHSALLRDLMRRVDRLAQRSRIVMLRGRAEGLAELAARCIQRPGKAWLDLAAAAPPDLDTLQDARGGLLFVHDIATLSRLQQKSLAFAIERLERFDLQILVGSSLSAQDLVANNWDELLVRRLFEAWTTLPSIAELRDDLPDIASQLLVNLVESGEVPLRRLSSGALNILRNRPWTGGLAELKAAIRSLALSALEEEISVAETEELLGSAVPKPDTLLPLDLPLREAREAFERVYFEYHLQLEAGNMARLAEKTGLERTHLYRKLKQLGLPVGRRGEE